MSAPATTLSTKRVLIADDSATVRSVMRGFLNDMSEIEICGEASNGLEAVEKAKQLKPDLVLLDLSMPHMNGAEVASVLKKTMPDVVIILFTMYSQNVGKSLTSAVGVDLVLSKPDGMAQLVRSIRSLLGPAA
jgi:two-component system response regulator NreC